MFAVAFGRLGSLIFAGGIVDNALVIRARIYADHSFFGIQLNSTIIAPYRRPSEFPRLFTLLTKQPTVMAVEGASANFAID